MNLCENEISRQYNTKTPKIIQDIFFVQITNLISVREQMVYG